MEKPDGLGRMAYDMDKDIYKEDIKSFAKDNRALTRSAKKLYTLVLGQFTESLRAKMKGNMTGKSRVTRENQWNY